MAKQLNDPASYLASLFEAGQDLMQKFTLEGGKSAAPGADPAAAFMAASKHFAEQQQNYLKQMNDFWSSMLGSTTPAENAIPSVAQAEDRRFTGGAWGEDPRFDMIRRTYLAYSGFLQDSVESAPVDDKAKDQLRFAVRQYADAMSPANFFATNPEAIQVAMETGGQSLTEGMGLFFQDLAKGRISMTDETVFEVGKNLAVTEGAVIFENELIQVIQYAPRTGQVSERPLVIIPPCINKYYILDLQPENSFVRYAVDQGHTVFLLSWRNATAEIDRLTWDDYLQKGVMQTIDVALDISGADKVNTLGFCVGGTLLAAALAVQAAQDVDKVASVTLLTTMLDFTDTGEIGMLVSKESVAAREAAIGRGGLLQGKELAFVFSSLRANDLIWQYVVNNYLKGKAPPAFDLLYWNSDGTNLPGPMFCWYVRNTYLENNLKAPGKTVQCGVPVDLSKISVPAYLYASREDHIVPWHTAYASNQALGGEATFVLGASGHIAGVINPASKNKRNYWADGVVGENAEEWLSTAQSKPGSWWPHWSAWLAIHAGPVVPARSALGNNHYQAIEPAPGRYVKAKAD
jgi:polyhydroxyalkanoate synthase subunit PhaC